MALVIVAHRVEDYNKWKRVYDEDVERRNKAGLKEVKCGRKKGDPDNVYLVWRTDDIAKFEKMMDNPELEEVMKKAGVKAKPEVTIVE